MTARIYRTPFTLRVTAPPRCTVWVRESSDRAFQLTGSVHVAYANAPPPVRWRGGLVRQFRGAIVDPRPPVESQLRIECLRVGTRNAAQGPSLRELRVALDGGPVLVSPGEPVELGITNTGELLLQLIVVFIVNVAGGGGGRDIVEAAARARPVEVLP